MDATCVWLTTDFSAILAGLGLSLSSTVFLKGDDASSGCFSSALAGYVPGYTIWPHHACSLTHAYVSSEMYTGESFL